MNDIDLDEEELVTCPTCNEVDDGDLFGCKVCRKIICQNCSSGGICESCEAKTGTITIHFK